MTINHAEIALKILTPFAQPITLTRNATVYNIDAILKCERDPERIGGAPFTTRASTLDLLTANANEINMTTGDEILIDAARYALTEPPYDEYGITRLYLRKLT